MNFLNVDVLKRLDSKYCILSRNINFSDIDMVLKFNCSFCDDDITNLIFEFLGYRKSINFDELSFCSSRFCSFLCDFLVNHGVDVNFSLDTCDSNSWFCSLLKQNNFKYCVLGKDDLNNLFVRYRNGDIKAKKEIVEHNIYLVVSIAKTKDSKNFNELVSYGIEGLYKAIDNFDETRGVCFSTYAYLWILKYITSGYGESNIPFKLSQSTYRLLKSINKYIVDNSDEFGNKPNIHEICSIFNIDYNDLVNLYPMVVGWIDYGCHEFVYSDKDCDEIISDYDIFDVINNDLDLDYVNYLLDIYSSLSDKNKKDTLMFRKYFIDGISKKQISFNYGISRSSVSNSINKVLKYVQKRVL